MLHNATLEFKKGYWLFYNRGALAPGSKGYTPITDIPEPMDKLDTFVHFMIKRYPGYKDSDFSEIKERWAFFNEGWETGKVISEAWGATYY
jgi:hypothetical protein